MQRGQTINKVIDMAIDELVANGGMKLIEKDSFKNSMINILTGKNTLMRLMINIWI